MSHPALDDFGDLDAAAADPHVAGCGPCQADLAAQLEIRSLLRTLPDPGPMPADVVERLETTLRQLAAAEPLAAVRDQRADQPSAASTVVPIGTARTARRRRPLLAVAAAAVIVAGGGFGLSQILPGSSGNDTTASGASAAISDRSNGLKEADSGGRVAPRTIASGHDYRRADLAAEVDQTMASAATAPAAGPKGPLASPQGVAHCVEALGAGSSVPLLVDLARFEGRPAAIVVLPAAGGGHEIWVVSTTCKPGQDGMQYFLTTR